MLTINRSKRFRIRLGQDKALQQFFPSASSPLPQGAELYTSNVYLERVALLYDLDKLQTQRNRWNTLKNLKARLNDVGLGEAACSQALDYIIARIQSFVTNPYGPTTEKAEINVQLKLFANLNLELAIKSNNGGTSDSKAVFMERMKTDKVLEAHYAALAHMPEKPFEQPDLKKCLSILCSSLIRPICDKSTVTYSPRWKE